jgi:alkanesulfonate monooxygenase SsuD/methylene tetrahydromethanopterin reductase-like flavin-dependent oxidoreductase (luciferase family)
VSPETARWLGGWADGLATVNQPRERLERVVEAFRDGGGEGKPMLLQVHLSWAASEEEALRIAHDQWRSNVFAPPLCWDLDSAGHFDEAARHVRPEDVREVVLVSADPARHAEWIREAAELGFDEIALHHVGKRQDAFIDEFGERVLPALA